jgi:hypothetical protein
LVPFQHPFRALARVDLAVGLEGRRGG